MEPFRVICVTCNAALRVRDAKLIGKILPCPKCNSMVQVEPPEDMGAEELAAATGAAVASSAPRTGTATTAAAANQTPTPPTPPPLPESAMASTASMDEVAAADSFGTIPTIPKPTWIKWFTIGSAGVLVSLAIVGGGYLLFAGDDEVAPTEPATVATSDKVVADAEETTEKGTVSETGDHAEASDKAVTAEPSRAAQEKAKPSPAKVVDAEQTPIVEKTASSKSELSNASETPATTIKDEAVEKDAVDQDAVNKPADSLAQQDKLAARPPQRPIEENSSEAEDASPEVQTPTPSARPKLPAADFDVTARLALKVGEVKFEKVPWQNIINSLSAMTAMPIDYDAATLARVGRSPQSPTTVVLQDAALGEVLSAITKRAGLSYIATGPRVIITVPPQDTARLTTAPHRTEDLAKSRASRRELAKIIRTVIAPMSWESAGGRGKIDTADGSLTITQTADVQISIVAFWDKLRVARGGTPKTRLNPKLASLKTRSALGREMLARKVSVRGTGDDTLRSLADRLGHRAKITIAIDEFALAAAGISGKEPSDLQVNTVPLSDALAKLLRPHNLTYHVVNYGLIKITTEATQLDAYDVEFYPVSELATDAESAEKLIARIEAAIAPGSWLKPNHVGDQQQADPGQGQGTMAFDRVSRCLIVRQLPDVQAEIETALARWRTR